jgi:apolipoprotein N-acyltransferase
MRWRGLLAACAGLVLSLAFEPVAVAWLIPVAVAGFVLTTRGLTFRRGFVVGLCFGARLLLHPHLLDARGRHPGPG